MRDGAPLLIVATDPAEGACIQTLLHVPVEALVAAPKQAAGFVEAATLGGMVIGCSCNQDDAAALAWAYLQDQPAGRVAVLTSATVFTSSAALVFSHPSVEVFRLPWKAADVRAFLGVDVEAPVGSAV